MIELFSQVIKLLNGMAFEVIRCLLIRLTLVFGRASLRSVLLGVVVVYNFGHFIDYTIQ